MKQSGLPQELSQPHTHLLLPSTTAFTSITRQQWKGREAGLLPQDWGWKESDGTLIPVTTNLDQAPTDLLHYSMV